MILDFRGEVFEHNICVGGNMDGGESKCLNCCSEVVEADKCDVIEACKYVDRKQACSYRWRARGRARLASCREFYSIPKAFKVQSLSRKVNQTPSAIPGGSLPELIDTGG